MGGSDLEGEGKQVLVGVCAMAKKSQSKPMKEILTRLEEFEYIKIIVFPEEVILKVRLKIDIRFINLLFHENIHL